MIHYPLKEPYQLQQKSVFRHPKIRVKYMLPRCGKIPKSYSTFEFHSWQGYAFNFHSQQNYGFNDLRSEPVEYLKIPKNGGFSANLCFDPVQNYGLSHRYTLRCDALRVTDEELARFDPVSRNFYGQARAAFRQGGMAAVQPFIEEANRARQEMANGPQMVAGQIPLSFALPEQEMVMA